MVSWNFETSKDILQSGTLRYLKAYKNQSVCCKNISDASSCPVSCVGLFKRILCLLASAEIHQRLWCPKCHPHTCKILSHWVALIKWQFCFWGPPFWYFSWIWMRLLLYEFYRNIARFFRCRFEKWISGLFRWRWKGVPGNLCWIYF